MTNISESGPANLPNPLEVLQSHGYAGLERLRDSERYVAYEVQKDGKRYFFKNTVGVSSSKLKSEIWFSEYLNSHQEDHSLAIAPEIIEFGSDWYVAEFLDGAPLCPEATCYETDLSPYVDTMARILQQIDGLPLITNVKRPAKDKFDVGPTDKVSMAAVELGVITPQIRSRALELVGNRLKTADKRLQHGDFTPWHIFVLDNGKFGLIDSEHAGRWPRFSDLAGLYTRLFNRCNAPETAAQTLVSFISTLEMSEGVFMDSFLPVITNKALLGCYDATRDWVKHDYRSSSRELVERCLSQDIKGLIEI